MNGKYGVIVQSVIDTCNKDLTQAKFKIGDVVRAFPNHVEDEFRGPKVTRVIAVNDTGDGIEYALDGWFVLLWEEELRK